MVHLTIIPKEDDIRDGLDIPLTSALKAVHLQLANDEDRFTTSVYGSKFAAADLPRHEMPDEEMPKEVAYRMIKDELSLDGNPLLKYDMASCFFSFFICPFANEPTTASPRLSPHTWRKKLKSS